MPYSQTELMNMISLMTTKSSNSINDILKLPFNITYVQYNLILDKIKEGSLK
jgi:hypothetical protein